MLLPFELDSRQEYEVQTLIECARLESGTDMGLYAESLYELFQESTNAYGDFTSEQLELLSFTFRQSLLPIGEVATGSELFKAS